MRAIKCDIPIQDLHADFETYYRDRLEQRPEPEYSLYIERNPLEGIHLTAAITQAFPEKEVKEILFTRTEPGYHVHTHVDGGQVYRERWHLPLYTNGTIFIEEDKEFYMIEGVWFGPVRQWLPHSVKAHDKGERVHMIVDFQDIIHPRKEGGYIVV